jgi:hypothetical protein
MPGQRNPALTGYFPAMTKPLSPVRANPQVDRLDSVIRGQSAAGFAVRNAGPS